MTKFFVDFRHSDSVESSVGSFDITKTFTFGTQLNGGFAQAGMEVNLPATLASSFIRRVLGSHATVYDNQGVYVYNGRVSSANASNVGVKIGCSGFWEDGKKITVPTALWLDPLTNNGQVISDLVDLVPSWVGGVNTGTMNVPVGPQDYNDEVKVSDMIDRMLKVGYRTDQIYASYLAVYNGRLVHAIKEHRGQFIDWLVGTGGSTKVGSSVSLQDVYNKIFILYDDTAEDSVGPTMYPVAAQDLGSQGQYGVRQGVLNVGEFGLGIGLDLQGIAIKKYARPRSNVPLMVEGYVQRSDGSYEPAYKVRAGQWIAIINSDEEAALQTMPEASQEGFVTSTSYSSDSASLKITLSSGDRKLDYLLARLGLSGGLS